MTQRSDLAAGLLVAVLLGELALAQVTVALTVCFMIIGRLSRWRPLWLAVPGAIGLASLLGIGISPAAAGYLAVTEHVLRLLSRHGALSVRTTELRDAFSGWRTWLPRQIPVALIAAAGQTAVLIRFGPGSRRRSYRRGWLLAARNRYLAITLRRGELATAGGCCVGIVEATGRRAEITWPEAEAGVLCTGRDASAVVATGLNLAVGAIQHRKAVIIVDAAGGALPESIESACAEAAAPLRSAEPRAAQIDLARAVADRAVVHFPLDRLAPGGPAVAIARSVVADLIEILTERADLGGRADCLVWVNGCDLLGPGQVAALLAVGERTGTAVVLGTVNGSAAAGLAADVNVVAVRGVSAPDEVGAADLADALAEFHAPGRQDALSIRVRSPRARLIAGSRPADFIAAQFIAAQRRAAR